jgi:hypothetical protein
MVYICLVLAGILYAFHRFMKEKAEEEKSEEAHNNLAQR